MRHLPNVITLLNLFCGCLAVLSIFHGRLDHVGLYVGLALVLDFLDGFTARMLNVQSPLGKQLDSLADMISFGLVPGLILFQLMIKSYFFYLYESTVLFTVFKYYMFIVTLFSALRLAKFNLDPRQSDHFIGLPTPANTIFIVALPVILNHDYFRLTPYILNPWILISIASFSAYMLVAEIPLIALKFKTLRLKDNVPQMMLIAAAILLSFRYNYAAVPLIIIFYIILSFIYPPAKPKTL